MTLADFCKVVHSFSVTAELLILVCTTLLLVYRYESDRHVRDCVRCYTKDYHTVTRRCVVAFHVQQNFVHLGH